MENAYGGNTHGASCFHIYGSYHWYDFKTNIGRTSERWLGMVTLNGEDCYWSVFALAEKNQIKAYEYRQYASLAPTKVYCRSSNVLYYLNGVEYILYLTYYLISCCSM